MASKEKNLEELMAQAQALLNEGKPRKKKKVEFQFHRDSVTGQRTSKYKYRPRVKSATDRLTLQSQSDLEDHEVFCEDTSDDQQQDDRSLHSLLTKCQDVLDSFTSVPDVNWEMCSECDASIHQYLPFHDRDALLDGSLRSIPPTFTVNNAGLLEQTRKHLLYDLMLKMCPHCHQEGTFVVCASPGFIIVVNQKGRFDFHNYHMSCSSCGYKVDPCSLDRMIAAGYWPGSPKDSSYFLDQNLFRQWDFLQKRLPGTSEVSFLRALGDFSQSKGRAPTITANTFSRSFKEWKFCMHEVEVSQGLSWMVCPACALKQHSCHVDGNAKLYCYKSSGTARKKNKLDETGLEIAGCRHGLAQWAVNMYQGEIYGYAHYLQCKKMLPAGVNFFWEDVVCKYWKWAAKVGGPATTVMKPALSVMHAKGHKWSCQVLWGGRWQDGSASTTGEEVEQINAHVSRCTNTTKYMLPEGRNEALTEQIFGWNRRKILAMVTSLVKRYTRAAKMCDSSNKDIGAVLTEFNIDRKALNLNEWKAQVLKVAKEEQLTANSRGELSELNQQKHQMEMLCFSIAQSTVAITKLADSSKQRTRLRRNIDSNKKQLQSMIEKFNALPANAGKTQVSLASLLAGGELPDDVAQSSDIPIRVKSKVVDAFQIHRRWLEEVNLLKEEMFNFLKFYAEIRIPALREEIMKIEDEIKAQAEFEEQEREPRTVSSLKASGSSADTAMGTVKYSCLDKHRLVHLGKVALLKKGLFFCQDQLNRGFNSFQKVLCENGGNLNEYIVADKDASVTVEDSCVEISGVEIDRNGGDEDDDHYVDNDDDNDGDDDEDTNSDYDNESPLLFSTCNLEINVPMRPCLSESGVCIWDFPRELSQSTFQGRNGSNACSIIALLLAQGIHKTNCDLFPSPFLPSDWVALVCGCIKVGNAIYDYSRGSLPHRYLSAGEAAMIAGDVLDVSVGQPKPVRVNDPHVPSTLRFHLLQLCNSSVTSYAVLIVNEKTVLFVSFPGETLVLIDSHLHGQTGAMVVLGNLCNLDDFVCVVGESVGFNSNTFGNLVQLSF